MISKLSLILNFGQVEAEILGLEHTRVIFIFHMNMEGFLTVVTTLLDHENLNLTFCIYLFWHFLHKQHRFQPKITEDIDF